jgi:hypothetical protein
MQSSFIDIGLERDGFLYVADVIDTMEEFDKLESGDEDGGARPPSRPESVPQAKIEDLLREGQEIIVQVVKEPLGTKGARLTSHVTMPGRFLVFMPTVDHVGVSRKIDSREERSRLRAIVREFREAHGFTGGVIIRTAASGRPKEDIVSDLEAFHKIWTEIRQKMESSRAPAVLYREPSIVGRLLRDLLNDDYQAVRIDNAQEYERVLDLIEHILPTPAESGFTEPFLIRGAWRPAGDRCALKSKVSPKSEDPSSTRPALVAMMEYAGCGQEDQRRLEDNHGHPTSKPCGNVRPGSPALTRRHHRPRPHRHGGQEEPAEGVSGGGAGAAQGPVAIQGASGLGLRARDHHAQARQTEPGARHDRTVSVLFGHRRHQIELNDLLRDPGRGEEGRAGAQRPPGAAPRESRYRPRPPGRRERRAA